MPKELHCPIDEETDQAIEARLAIEPMGKGEFLLRAVKKELRGKFNTEGKDPLSTKLRELGEVKLAIKDLKKEIPQVLKAISESKELHELVQKLPAFIDMRQNTDQLLKNLANNSSLTTEEKSHFSDELSELSRKCNDFFLTIAKLLYDQGIHELGEGIYCYESRFIDMKTWDLLEKYIDTKGSGDYSCDVAKQAIREWIVKDYRKEDAERLHYHSAHLFENELSRQTFESNFSDLRSGTIVKTEKPQDTTKPVETKPQDAGKPESTTKPEETKSEDTKELRTPGALSFYRQAKENDKDPENT